MEDVLDTVALVACPLPLCIEKDCKCSEGIGEDGGESTGIISCAKSLMSSTVNCVLPIEPVPIVSLMRSVKPGR